MPNFYKELPENAKVVKTIDAKNKKTMLIFNLVAIFIMIGSILPIIILKDFTLESININPKDMLIGLAVYLIGTVIYIILHELTHGVVYKTMTKEKLTFGLTLSCAFCGVPKIYVTRKTALLSILAPFVVEYS